MTLAVTILTDKFDRALLYATHVHGGGSEDMAIAGLLHDAVEDQGGEPRLADIRNRFGEIDERQATNQHEVYVSIWAKAVETQMHFNEMAVKSRQFGLAFVAAALGLGIVLIARGEDVGIPIPYVLGWQLPVSHTIKQTRFRASCSARAPSVSWPQGLLADRGALASISRAFVLARDCDGSASPTQQCFQIVLSPQSQKVGVHQLFLPLDCKVQRDGGQ